MGHHGTAASHHTACETKEICSRGKSLLVVYVGANRRSDLIAMESSVIEVKSWIGNICCR